MSQNGVIHLYQDILKILYRDPTKDITKNKRNVFIDFKYLNSNFFTIRTDYDRRLIVSRRSSNEWKHNFIQHQQKLNVSVNICHEENTKTLDYFLVDKKQQPWFNSQPSAVVQENSLIVNIST